MLKKMAGWGWRVSPRPTQPGVSDSSSKVTDPDAGARRASRCPPPGRRRARVRSVGSRTPVRRPARSEEHTSELQSLMRISYAVFCLQKKKKTLRHTTANAHQQQKYA